MGRKVIINIFYWEFLHCKNGKYFISLEILYFLFEFYFNLGSESSGSGGLSPK